MFIGTNDACNINAKIPIITDDDQEEGAAAATFPPSAPAVETDTANNTGKSGKGTKGKIGSGKNGSGKAGKKGEKGMASPKPYNFEKVIEGEEGHKKMDERMSQSDSKLVKQNKEKGGKGGQYFYYSGYERHLQKIEYHQSRIEYYKKLLMYNEY